MRISNTRIFLSFALFFMWVSTALAQVETDSVIIVEPRDPSDIEIDSVLADTTAILEYPAKPYVTADEVDTVEVADTEKEYSPRKAALYSALLPGLGQAYNKKYWKIPLVYGGIVGFGLAIDFYSDLYTKYRRNLLMQRATGTNELDVTERVLSNATDRARRERDYFIILSGLFYLLNVVDAHIDAHLKGFDVSNDLALRLEPSIHSTAFNTQVGGMALVLYIK